MKIKIFKRINNDWEHKVQDSELILFQVGLNQHFYSLKNRKRPYFTLAIPLMFPKLQLLDDVYDTYHLVKCVPVLSMKFKFIRSLFPCIRVRFGRLPIDACLNHSDCSIAHTHVFDWSLGSGGKKEKIGFAI